MNPLGLLSTDSELIAKVQALADYPLGELTSLYAKKKNIDLATASEHELAFRRFMSLSFLTSDAVAPTEDIDDYWHHFILWTRIYTDFCNVNFGQYVHHSPGHAEGGDAELRAAGNLADSLFVTYYGISVEKDIERPYKCKKICLIK